MLSLNDWAQCINVLGPLLNGPKYNVGTSSLPPSSFTWLGPKQKRQFWTWNRQLWGSQSYLGPTSSIKSYSGPKIWSQLPVVNQNLGPSLTTWLGPSLTMCWAQRPRVWSQPPSANQIWSQLGKPIKLRFLLGPKFITQDIETRETVFCHWSQFGPITYHL